MLEPAPHRPAPSQVALLDPSAKSQGEISPHLRSSQTRDHMIMFSFSQVHTYHSETHTYSPERPDTTK